MFVTSSLSGDFLSLVVALLVIFIGYYKWTYQYWHRRNVPYFKPRIPLGNVSKALRGKEHIGVSLKRVYNEMKSKGWKHGGIFIFDKPNYIPIDADYIKNIMTKDFQYFADRDMFVNEKRPLQAHLLNLTGTRWKILRAKLTPTFTSGKMKMMFNIMAESQNDLQKRMRQEYLKKEPINIKEILACFTTNIIGSCAFGLDCKALEKEDSAFRVIGRKMFTPNKWRAFVQKFGVAFPRLATYLNFSTGNTGVSTFITNMVEDTIKHREKNNYTRNDFLQMLIGLKNNPIDGESLTMDELASQCLVFFAAGFETSSTLMTFALYELAKNQEVQKRLRKEINSVLEKHNNEISYESINDMKYLTQVIDETLRFHPPAASTNRRCIKDYKVPDEDVIIEKGTAVLIPILAIHHDEEYYPNPSKFDPERFNDHNRNSRPNHVFLPFGEGPRNCIGMRFGLLQSKMGLVSLLKKYNFTLSQRTQEPLLYQPSSPVLSAVGDIWLDAQEL